MRLDPIGRRDICLKCAEARCVGTALLAFRGTGSYSTTKDRGLGIVSRTDVGLSSIATLEGEGLYVTMGGFSRRSRDRVSQKRLA